MTYLVWDIGTRDGLSWLGAAATTIGRTSKNKVELPDRRISKAHARIEQALNGGDLLLDLGSTNGTTVNATQVKGESQALKDGDRICFAGAFCATYRTRLVASEITEIYDGRDKTYVPELAA